MLKALPPGTEVNIFLTNDPFDKVAALYQGTGKESSCPACQRKAASYQLARS